MGDKTAIEWTSTSNADGTVTPGATWNPVVGCDRISPGCSRCYAKNIHDRRHKAVLSGKVMPLQYAEPFEVVRTRPDRLDLPLRWRQPRKIFVNSMSDLFHEDVPDAFIDRVFEVMALASRHTFQVLTKRPDRMREYVAVRIGGVLEAGVDRWPLPNVWLGVSVENQHFADERIPLLLLTPAAVRFISAEPLLGPLSIERHLRGRRTIHMSADVEGMVANQSFDGLNDNGRPLTRREAETGLRELLAKGVKRIRMSDECVGFDDQAGCPGHPEPSVDWVIAGGESGPDARPSDPAWFQSLRDQCVAAGLPFFFKQWGEWAPGECAEHPATRTERTATAIDGVWHFGALTPRASEDTHIDDQPDLYRFGKKRAGRSLDGRIWDEFPKARA